MAKMAGEKRCAIEWIGEHTKRLFDFSIAGLVLRRAGLAQVQIGESLRPYQAPWTGVHAWAAEHSGPHSALSRTALAR
jgi:hypothetical protein